MRVERRDESHTRHKLAAVAEGPFPVKSVKGHTVVIVRPDGTVERVSRDRVVHAPEPLTTAQSQEVTRPLTDEELTANDFPVAEEVNLRDVIRRPQQHQHQDTTASTPPGPDNSIEPRPNTRRSKRIKRQGSQLRYEASTQATPTQPDTRAQRASRRARQRDQPQPTVPTDSNDGTLPGEYVIDKVVSHGVNTDPQHPTAAVGETTYRVRWYDYGPDEATFEPIRHLPRNKVVSYYKRRKLSLPEDIHEAVQG